MEINEREKRERDDVRDLLLHGDDSKCSCTSSRLAWLTHTTLLTVLPFTRIPSTICSTGAGLELKTNDGPTQLTSNPRTSQPEYRAT